MTVDDARNLYLSIAHSLDVDRCWDCEDGTCAAGQSESLAAEAASIGLDLAVAEASRQRMRESVPW